VAIFIDLLENIIVTIFIGLLEYSYIKLNYYWKLFV